MNPLPNVYGTLLMVRAPVPATCNKAGANYKSEVAHQEYFPRQAFDEWLQILDGIVACGGDALFEFESVDDVYLDHSQLHVDDRGDIRGDGASHVLGNLLDVETGRVFAANGPWVVKRDTTLVAVMPHMLAHRRSEATYYRSMLANIAKDADLSLEVHDNPYRWEGMADVAVVGNQVVLTYAVPGHYDENTSPKSSRSSRDGVSFAATTVGVQPAACIFAELVYPHFHGDTVHFGVRGSGGKAHKLAHFAGGLWRDQSATMAEQLPTNSIVAIGRHDAVEQYAGNSRQIADGVLVPDGVSSEFIASLQQLGLTTHRVPLFELFGKAGGGPACATLYLPANLSLPPTSTLRFSNKRDQVLARRERIPQRLTIAPGYFAGKDRG
jgi:hypothetical protein